MYQTISLSEYFYLREKQHRDTQAFFESTRKKLDRIKKLALATIEYPTFREAYDYVDSLFPAAKVKEVVVYKVPVQIMEKLGFNGVEGFYSHLDHTVVIAGTRKNDIQFSRSPVRARVEKDEVLAHELIHYAYVAEGHYSVSSQMREEFAYGWSIGYLRQKGYTDSQIVKFNFLPYLFSIVYQDAIEATLTEMGIAKSDFREYSSYERKNFFRINERRINAQAKELAIDKGNQLIELYSQKMEDGCEHTDDEEEGFSRFELFELD